MKLKIPSKYLESDTQIFRWDFHISHYFIFNLILIPQGSIRPCKRSVSIIRIRTRSIIFPFSGTILIKSLIVQPFLIHNNQRRLRILRRCFRRIFCPLFTSRSLGPFSAAIFIIQSSAAIIPVSICGTIYIICPGTILRPNCDLFIR